MSCQCKREDAEQVAVAKEDGETDTQVDGEQEECTQLKS